MNNKGKLFGLALAFVAWTGAAFWVGWQSPTLIGGFFGPKEPVVEAAKFYPLDKFVLSIPGEEYSHYLLLELAIKTRSKDAQFTLTQADSVIKNSLMKMFSNKHFDELNDTKQFEPLQKEALNILSVVLAQNDFDIELDDVLFTRMIIQ
ncbi:flagellar basal body-associated FliL family protein [Shewanella halifaxensis]|uniref:flagellar basal body-associated FliL family protein n=1 Tax=Shewanella halifaxensis TaxID=271098 RepID=UPI000D596FA9|nr:flagellar basal body-associated FliL family protein [Shewanella halifaxensis]